MVIRRIQFLDRQRCVWIALRAALPQPHAWSTAILGDELDAGGFECANNGRLICLGHRQTGLDPLYCGRGYAGQFGQLNLGDVQKNTCSCDLVRLNSFVIQFSVPDIF